MASLAEGKTPRELPGRKLSGLPNGIVSLKADGRFPGNFLFGGLDVDWRVWAIRGAVTVPENTEAAMRDAVTELLDGLETRNHLDPTDIISATFSVTRDLDAIFPAAIARQRPRWDSVPLLDVQHMYVVDSLPRCVRLLMHVQLPITHGPVHHVYLRAAKNLRPDLSVSGLSGG
jgi:chorismate mutase